jgi:EmrB/QacA subfamily drug resistance transporter
MSTRWQAFLVTALGVFMVYLDGTIVNIAFPAIGVSFAPAPPAELSWVLNAYSIGFAALLLGAGQLADRLGRRRLFFAGLSVFTLGSVLCGLAPSAPGLVADRVLQAAGAALLAPASLALLIDAFPPDRRTTMVGLYGAVAALAVALGPSLGSLIVEHAGWRWAFLINVPVGLIAWTWGQRVLRESRDPSAKGRPDVLGLALLTLTMGALALAIVQGNDWGWRDPRVVVAFAVAACGVPLGVRRAAHAPVPVVDLSLFSVRSFSVANAAMVLFTAAFYGGLLGHVLFLTSVWRYSLVQAGLALTPAPLCATVAGAAAAHLAARYGHRAVILPGILCFTAGMLLLRLHLGPAPAFLAEWLLPNLLLGTGVGLALPTLSSATTAALPASRLAMGSAVGNTARQFGAVLGVALLISVAGTPALDDLVGTFQRAYGLFMGMALISGAICLGLGRPAAQEQHTPASVIGAVA